MTSSRFWFRIPALVLFCLLMISQVSAADETLVAKVGAIPVSVYELQRQIQRILPLQVSFHGGISQEKLDEIKSQAMEELIERSLMVQYALVEELSVPNSRVEEEMSRIRSKFDTKEEFEAAVGNEGVANFRASVYRSLLAEKAEQSAVDDQVRITNDEVRAYYEKNQERFMRPRQFQASHILIKVDPASNAEERKALKEKADQLAERALSGEDFYNLAYYNSDDRTKFVGGKLGSFHEGQTVKEFEQAILQMEPGEISGPVKTMYGYHIIKLHDVQEPKQLTFEDMAGKIRDQLEKATTEKLKAQWLAELRASYPVEIYQ